MVESIKIKNLKTDIIKRFDMSEADYLIYEGSVDWGNIRVTHSTFQFPQQIGLYVSNTTLGSRDVSINGWIIGNTLQDIESKKRSLSLFANPLDEFQLIVGEYAINGNLNSNVTFGKTYKENNAVAVKFLLQFTCPYPLFVLTNAITLDVSKFVGAFHFPLIIPEESGIIMGYRKQTLFQKVGNSGVVPVGMTVILEASGTVNNPTIVNTTTHETLRINKILSAGEKIVINTLQGEHNVVGYNENGVESYLKYMDYDSLWLQVPPGVSTFSYATYDENGEQDDTYLLLDVTIQYKTALFNLGDE